jgi:PAS domain S-box-containing protein
MLYESRPFYDNPIAGFAHLRLLPADATDRRGFVFLAADELFERTIGFSEAKSEVIANTNVVVTLSTETASEATNDEVVPGLVTLSTETASEATNDEVVPGLAHLRRQSLAGLSSHELAARPDLLDPDWLKALLSAVGKDNNAETAFYSTSCKQNVHIRVYKAGEDQVSVLLLSQPKENELLKELRENRFWTDKLQEVGNIGSWKLDLIENKLTWSDQVYRIFGLQPGEFPATYEAFLEYVHPDDRYAVNEAYMSSLRDGRNQYEITHRVVQKTTREIRYVREKCEHFVDQAGTIIYSLGVVQDITESKQHFDALTESEEKFRLLVGNISDMVWIIQVDGTISYIAPSWTQIMGADSSDMIGNPFQRYLHSEDVAVCEAYVRKTIVARKTLPGPQYRVRHSNGDWRWHEATITPVYDHTGTLVHFVGVSRDITLQKNAEAERQELLDRFEQLGKHLPGFIYQYLLRPDGSSCFPYASTGILRIYGVHPQDVELDAGPVFNVVHPDDLQRISDSISDSAEHLTVWHETYRVILPTGELIWTEGLATPERLADGSTLWHGYIYDVTERVGIEEALKKAKSEAEAASQAKSLFLANMSHEIRTPLNGVIGFTELLKTTSLTALQQQYVDHANVSGHNLLKIINDILDLSKIEAGMLELETTRTDLVDLMESAIDIVKFVAGKKELELLLHLDPSLPRLINTDPVRLTQIITNLLSNAVKFTEKGEVELKASYKSNSNGKYHITFSVRDTGIGISEEQRSRLFRVFSQADKSTTRRFGGTGLGLMISKMIAEKMGSQIEFTSQPGQGTTFYFDLQTQADGGIAYGTTLSSKIQRCLIVEDHSIGRTILERMLHHCGVKTVSCANGLEAIKLLETRDHFDAMIVDYKMPYVDGLQTVRIVREKLDIPPEAMPVILLHSITDDLPRNQLNSDLGIAKLITKPVKNSQLLDSLNHIGTSGPGTSETLFSDEISLNNDLSLVFHSQKPASILIAEDNNLNMYLVKALLAKLIPEARFTEATTGKEALEHYSRSIPDLIFMDVHMPEMNGLEATKAIRAVERQVGLQPVPIVALTAGALKEEREECFEAGMNYFLPKPIELTKLRSVLEKFLLEARE